MRVFLGIQPIFDRSLHTFGYELLFRSGMGSTGFDGADAVTATSTVISNTFLSIGADKILGRGRGFINFPRELLLDESTAALPSRTVVVEVLETVHPDAQVVSACRKLKKAGFLLALDDFVMHPDYAQLLKIADFVKVDFRATSKEQCRVLGGLRRNGLRMLAEKVETQAELDDALAMGYEYFQGYFFAKPKMVSAGDVPACKLNSVRLLREVQEPELDFDRLERLTRMEVSLARKLLRYVNSAAFGRRVEIHSIKNALVLLGEAEIRKVVSLAIMPGLVTDKPPELVRSSLLRARTCETIAAHSGLRSRQSDCFLMGLFSLLDAMIGRPLDVLIKELGLPGDVRQALVEGPDAQSPLRSVYNLCLACEQADFAGIKEHSSKLEISPDEVSDLFLDALAWSEELYQETVQ